MDVDLELFFRCCVLRYGFRAWLAQGWLLDFGAVFTTNSAFRITYTRTTLPQPHWASLNPRFPSLLPLTLSLPFPSPRQILKTLGLLLLRTTRPLRSEPLGFLGPLPATPVYREVWRVGIRILRLLVRRPIRRL